MRQFLGAVVAGLLLAAAAAAAAVGGELVNEKVIRSIRLAGNHAVVKIGLRVRNDGADDASAYDIVLDRQRAEQLADAELVVQGERRLFQHVQDREDGSRVYRAQLTVGAGDSLTCSVNLVFVHMVEPSPRRMVQMEKLFVVVHESDVWLSPYPTKTQTTSFRLGTSEIAFHSPHGKKKKTAVVYGPVENTEPFAEGTPLQIRFFHDKALATATRMVKEIEISHWGNVAVEERYEVTNSGAELIGGFSRVDYDSMVPTAKAGAFHWMHADFPVGATDIYVRDDLGNVSTSHIRHELHQVHAEIASRFPLYGGWKADFYLGYNLASDQALYLEDSKGRFVLQMEFGTPFDDLVVDEYVLRVIIPEGAKDIEWEAPFLDIESESGLRFTYMDIIGRPVVELRKRNVVSKIHNQLFQVSYSMPPFHLWREPAMLFTGFMAFFLVCTIYMRLDLSLTTGVSEKSILTDEERNAINAVTRASESFNKLMRLCIDKKDAKAVHQKFLQQLKTVAQTYPSAATSIESHLSMMWKLRANPDNSKFTTEVCKIEDQFRELLGE